MKTLYDDLNKLAKEFSKDKVDCRLQMNKSIRKYINKVEKKLFDLASKGIFKFEDFRPYYFYSFVKINIVIEYFTSKGIDCDVETEFHGFENPTEYPRLVYCWS